MLNDFNCPKFTIKVLLFTSINYCLYYSTWYEACYSFVKTYEVYASKVMSLCTAQINCNKFISRSQVYCTRTTLVSTKYAS